LVAAEMEQDLSAVVFILKEPPLFTKKNKKKHQGSETEQPIMT